MNDNQKVTYVKALGNTTIELKSDQFDGMILDTAVYIGGTYVCTVAGAKRQEFVNRLAGLIEKYRI